MTLERRQHPRLVISIDVDFGSEHNFYTGSTRDISLGGLFINTDVGLQVGSELTVRMQLLDQRFVIPCEVVWALLDEGGRNMGVGVRFLKLSRARRKAFEEFMAQRGPLDFEVKDEPEPGAAKKTPPPLPDPKEPRGKG
jgi:uncharacterized protein (TIGR02266 family)